MPSSFRYIGADSYRCRQHLLILILVTLLGIQLDSADIYRVDFSHGTRNWRETSEIAVDKKGISIHIVLSYSGKIYYLGMFPKLKP